MFMRWFWDAPKPESRPSNRLRFASAISGGGQRGSSDYLRAAELLGADQTLRKPFAPEKLLAVADELLASGSEKS